MHKVMSMLSELISRINRTEIISLSALTDMEHTRQEWKEGKQKNCTNNDWKLPRLSQKMEAMNRIVLIQKLMIFLFPFYVGFLEATSPNCKQTWNSCRKHGTAAKYHKENEQVTDN